MQTTRDRLVDSAQELFLERGYHSTSVADILTAASANSGSLYHYFPTKQHLLLAVLEKYLTGIGPMLLEPAWQGEDDPVERVFALLDHYRNLLRETNFQFGCPIGLLAMEFHDPDSQLREGLQANFGAWAGAVRTCLDQAADQLRPQVNRSELADFVLAVMEGGVMLARTYRDLAPFDACVRQLRAYFRTLLERGGAEDEPSRHMGSGQ